MLFDRCFPLGTLKGSGFFFLFQSPYFVAKRYIDLRMLMNRESIRLSIYSLIIELSQDRNSYS